MARFCSHNFVYTQGHFYCTKCGKRSYGKHREKRSYGKHRGKRQAKKIGIGISLMLLVGVVGFLFVNGVFQINQENLQETIQKIPLELPKIEELPTLVSNPIQPMKGTPVEVKKEIPVQSHQETPKVTETPVVIQSHTESLIEQSKQNINYINQIRIEKGRTPITFDQRAYDLGLARVQDVNQYNYFDHTNPITGTCADTMKTKYGFSSNEFVAENLAGGISSPKSAVDLWLSSQGHRYNLLYTDHKSGATACEGGTCVFLGVNYDQFGEGCHTGEEGMAWHESLGKCTDEQFAQMDKLREKYDSLSKEYDRFPQMSRSQEEYQQAMNMYNQLQSLYNQIENFRC